LALEFPKDSKTAFVTGLDIAGEPTSEPSEEWNEELEAMEAIYASESTLVNPRQLQLILDDGRMALDLRCPMHGVYPSAPPLIALRCILALPCSFLHFCQS
jgi:hypothetical protein